MKIGPSLYNHIGLEVNHQPNVQHSEFDRAVSNLGDAGKVAETDQIEVARNASKITSKDKVSLSTHPNTNPTTVSDVLTDQEQAMINQLFPPEGLRWGVSAYEGLTTAQASAAKGLKVDVTT